MSEQHLNHTEESKIIVTVIDILSIFVETQVIECDVRKTAKKHGNIEVISNNRVFRSMTFDRTVVDQN